MASQDVNRGPAISCENIDDVVGISSRGDRDCEPNLVSSLETDKASLLVPKFVNKFNINSQTSSPNPKTLSITSYKQKPPISPMQQSIKSISNSSKNKTSCNEFEGESF